MGICANQNLRTQSAIAGSRDTVEASEVFEKEFTALTLSRKLDN